MKPNWIQKHKWLLKKYNKRQWTELLIQQELSMNEKNLDFMDPNKVFAVCHEHRPQTYAY